MRHIAIYCIFLVLAACSSGDDTDWVAECDNPALADTTRCAAISAPPELPSIQTSDLPGFFDCVRESGGLLIAAHRAGPIDGFPENALETLQHGHNSGLRVFEIDVATSRDGILFLMHDRTLERTTTTRGSTGNADWARLSNANLVDNSGQRTSFHPPKLVDALIWARDEGAILELDKKETTSWHSLISAVRAAKAENNVILITYSDSDAGLVQELASEMMLTANARGDRDIARLRRRGVNPKKTIAWTGTERPDSLAWGRLSREGVEAAFGTLGRPSERLDRTYWADDDPSEYRQMIADGLTLLATDEPHRLADAITEDDRALNACAS